MNAFLLVRVQFADNSCYNDNKYKQYNNCTHIFYEPGHDSSSFDLLFSHEIYLASTANVLLLISAFLLGRSSKKKNSTITTMAATVPMPKPPPLSRLEI